jgi:hypothetical protein
MDKKLFKRLVESMGQMDEIVRDVRSQSREYPARCAACVWIRNS